VVKVGIAIALVLAIAALSVFGSPLFAILLVAPAALIYTAWAGGAVAAATPEEGSAEDSPENVGGGEPEGRGRPAGTEADRAFRRERAEKLREDG